MDEVHRTNFVCVAPLPEITSPVGSTIPQTHTHSSFSVPAQKLKALKI